MRKTSLALLMAFALAGAAEAKVDLVTLPTRDMVQMTIYNSADLTLVRESRALTLKEGINRLQFSWANTLIDPTSLEMQPTAQADRIEILDLTYPPRVQNLGLWTIRADLSCRVPVEISYLTSGLSWRVFYLGTLTVDEEMMRLQGYIRVTNRSGEGYENAQTRLIVGRVHILDEIAELAQRKYPYGKPAMVPPGVPPLAPPVEEAKRAAKAVLMEVLAGEAAPKEIKKEGLSEYFLYTIEGTETIPNGWSKRLPSFTTDRVPVDNLYKYEEELYGQTVFRFLSFKNDQSHGLGQTPIPGGVLKVFREVDEIGHLSYVGQSNFKYIPVGEDVELNLGPVKTVIVKPTLMSFRTDNYLFGNDGNIAGWAEIREFRIDVKNHHRRAVKVEVTRNFDTHHWDLQKSGDFDTFEKVDLDTVRFALALQGFSQRTFRYVLTTHHGRRAE